MPSSLWSSPIVSGIAATCSLYIVFIMTVMCLIMYSKQRRQAYLYMVLAFLFIMAYEGMNIHFNLTDRDAVYRSSLWSMRMQVFSFLLLNASVYLLYRKMNKVGYILLSLMILLFLVPLFPLGFPPFNTTSGQFLYLNLHQGIVIIIGLWLISPRIGQQFKYIFGSIISLIWVVMTIINLYTDQFNIALNTLRLLLPLLYHTVIFFILFQRIVEQMQSIYRSSITDGLTNLYNRRFFMKNVNRYVDQGLKVSIIFCDIDNFKKLNDTQGHAKADEVLIQVANILEEEVSGVGLSGRYGGEELVAALVDKRANVSQIAESIRARIEQESIVTISVGYSSLRKNVTADELVSQADQAMYRSKTTGKNKVSPFHAPRSKKVPLQD
ncbi:GGDEF domain-containing protein [Paenibacillus sp. FA6]|uniref:GGDEF domain-containing protein n=1 Tax=Paenibacillus sp. FA6 TaxID=3413029 RepID=UPI003F65840C